MIKGFCFCFSLMTQREQSFPIFSSNGDRCIHVVEFISLSFYGVSVWCHGWRRVPCSEVIIFLVLL